MLRRYYFKYIAWRTAKLAERYGLQQELWDSYQRSNHA